MTAVVEAVEPTEEINPHYVNVVIRFTDWTVLNQLEALLDNNSTVTGYSFDELAD